MNNISYRKDIRSIEKMNKDRVTGEKNENDAIKYLAEFTNRNSSMFGFRSYERMDNSKFKKNYIDKGDFRINLIEFIELTSHFFIIDVKTKTNNSNKYFRFKEKDIHKCIRNDWPIFYFHNFGGSKCLFRVFSINELNNLCANFTPEIIPQFGNKMGWKLSIDNFNMWFDFNKNNISILNKNLEKII